MARRHIVDYASSKEQAQRQAATARSFGYQSVKIVKDSGGYKVTAAAVLKKRNPSMKIPKLGKWISAAKVRLVKKNGVKVLEIQK